MKNPIILPNGDLIHGDQIASINHYPESGIALKGENGNSLSFVKEPDNDKALHIRSELIKVVQAVNSKERYQPNFDLPSKTKLGEAKK